MKLSIIIPAFNVAPWIKDAVDSVLEQGFKNWELIVVDDGSTDETSAIVDRIAAEDRRISVIHQQNAGPGVARNAGIDLARGDYLMFLDSDDRLASPSVLSSMVERACNTGCDVLLARARSIGLHGEPGKELAWCLRKDLLPARNVFSPNDVGVSLFFVSGPVPWGKLYRREFVNGERLRFPPLARSEDFPFVQTAMACAGRIAVFDDIMVLHRTGRTDSLESTKDSTPLIFAEAESIFFRMLEERGLWRGFSVSAKARALLRLSYNVDKMHTPDAAEKIFAQLKRLLDMYCLPVDFCEMPDVIRIMLRLDAMTQCGSFKEWSLHRNVLLKVLDAQMRYVSSISEGLRQCYCEIDSLKSSIAYRVGMLVTWPARKVWRGLFYAIKHVLAMGVRLFGAKMNNMSINVALVFGLAVFRLGTR